MKQKAYAAAGVNIDLGNKVKATLPRLLAGAQRREVLGQVGGFGGLFALDARKFRQPVLVASTDGVGTKLKIAFAMDRHDTVGQDLVNHCVNDIAVLGAEPLFFLDYIGTGKLEARVFTQLLAGFARACAANHCALLGGETAQMPGFYRPGEYDLSGTIVGVVEKAAHSRRQKHPARRRGHRAGIQRPAHQRLFAGAQDFFRADETPTGQPLCANWTTRIGAELLKVHRSYGPLVRKLLQKFNPSAPGARPAVKGLAHITGGGFIDNIPRVLPRKCDALVRKGSWDAPPIFELIRARGGVAEAELYQVFNMGIGMTIIVAADQAEAALRFVRAQQQRAWLIGEVVPGAGIVQMI